LGIGRNSSSPEYSMYREGRAMRDALCADFSRIPGVEAFACPDAAAPPTQEQFKEMCRKADWTALIAPAFNDCLGSLAETVSLCGSRLLGPSPAAIRLVSDKLKLAALWRDCGIRTPATTDREPSACEAFPLVWKPRDGAGSSITFLLNSTRDVV